MANLELQVRTSMQGTQSQCLCGPEERLRRVLMVRRLHPAVTMQMLLQTFGAFGSVTGCKVFTHKSGRSAGCASLEFSNHQAACAALKGLQGTLLHGKHVMLQWFDQSLSSATSPVGPRGPGQRSELPAGALSEGGSCAAITGRQLPSGTNCAGPIRSSAASCPGLSPFGLFAAAPPTAHPFCNSTAAMAAAAAAAAAVAAQQQQMQHPNNAAAATAAALLSGQHSLPPLVVQQLQRQVSAPHGHFGQLSPTASHIPPSPLTPGSHGGGWEALMSPAGPHCGQQPFTPQHQQRDCAGSSRGGAGGADGQQQGWGAVSGLQHSPAHLAAAAAQLSAAMSSGSIPLCPADSISMAASLQQQLASMQHQAFAYAAWQNQQQAAAVLLQHQLSGQLSHASMLGGSQHAQMHLLGARSMPSELGNSLSAEFFLQQANSNLQQQQAQAQSFNSSEAGSSGDRGQHMSAGTLSRQHSTPVGTGLLSAEACAAALQQQQQADSSSAGGADSIPAAGAAGAAGSFDQAGGGARIRSPGSLRRKSTGALGAEGANSGSKAGAEAGQLTAKKQLHWEDQRQTAADQKDASGCEDGSAGTAGGEKTCGFGGSSADGSRAAGRNSSHQLLSPLRGYSGSDDTANISPDVNALASALATQQQNAAAAAVSSTYPAWLASQKQGLSASQVTPELLASLQGPSLRPAGPHTSQGLMRSPSAAAALQSQQQQNLILAAAAAAANGSPSSSSGYANGSFGQQQQQLGHFRSSREHLMSRVSDSQVLAGGRSGDSSASSSYPQSGMLFSSPSLPGPSAVAAALDAMTVAASEASQSWQQRQAGMFAAGGAAEVPASEAFKHKHKMHLQLPAEGAVAHSKPATSAAGGNGSDQLITTEVLPESPLAQQRQLPAQATHTPFGPLSTAVGAADTGSAWADWSASMAALLSPAHVNSLASRRFEDLITLQHGMAQEAAAAAAAAHGQAAACMQQQSLPGALDAAAAGARFGSTSSQAAWLLQQSRAEQQQVSGFAAAASRPGSLMTGAGSDMFGAGAGESISEGGVAMALKTRHNSLCLDSRPGLLTLSHMFQEAAAQHGAAAAAARASPRGNRAASPQQQQAGAAARRAVPREMEGGNTGFGSFTFQPPVLRSLQASGLSAGSSNSQMICQPFQLPDFFSRDSRMGCTSPRGSVSTPGAASAAAGRGAHGSGSPLDPSGMQHQYSENLNGTCIAEESFSGNLDGTDRAPGSPCGPRPLQHSFSMPVRFSAPGGAGDALAAAAAAAVAANAASAQERQQEEEQQQQAGGRATRAPYGEVFNTIWGPSSAGSLQG